MLYVLVIFRCDLQIVISMALMLHHIVFLRSVYNTYILTNTFYP